MEPIIIVLFLIFFITAVVIGARQRAQRRKELLAWASQWGMSFDPGHRRDFDDLFPDVKEFRQGSNRYAYNFLRGAWAGRNFCGFEYHYETHSTDSKGRRHTHNHYFSAVMLASDIPLQPLRIRPENFMDKVGEFFGADDIDFESAEFSRRFHVSAADRKWAFDILHQRAIQFLLSQPEFTIQFTRGQAFAIGSSTFDAKKYEAAAGVLTGLFDQIPDYVKEARRDRTSAGAGG